MNQVWTWQEMKQITTFMFNIVDKFKIVMII
jgi:hypothetical protein